MTMSDEALWADDAVSKAAASSSETRRRTRTMALQSVGGRRPSVVPVAASRAKVSVTNSARIRNGGMTRLRATLAQRRETMSAGRLRGCLVAVCVILVAGSAASGVGAATALPAHVYAPYFETWTTDSISSIAQQSGSRYFTLAFLETLSKTSCTLGWNGTRTDLVSRGRY